MASRRRAMARPVPGPPSTSSAVRRPVAIGAMVVMAVALTLQADAAPRDERAVELSGSVARERGVAIDLVRPAGLPEPVVLVGRAANPPGADTGSDPRTVLDLAPGGRLVAVADRIGPDTTDLVIGRPDGSQLRMTMPGLLAGAFGPDGAQLAVIDGLGRLQIVSTGDGTARIAADGPFLGPLTYDEGGVMLLAVSSVEAPFVSRLGRVFPDTGAFASLDDAELAYSGTLLADGSIAVVAHTPTGPTVRRRQSGLTTVLAELEPGAIHVAVAPDGGRIAWEADGGIFVRAADGSVRGLGSGSRPRFAPDGRALLVDDGGQATLLVLASGTRIPLGSSGAVFDRCVTGCPS